MQIFSDEKGKGDTVIVLTKADGKALVQALEVATARKKDQVKPLRAGSKAYKVAHEIEMSLPVF